MLGRRVLTAIVLLAVLLPAIFWFPPIVWNLVTLGFLATGAWEWDRLLPGGPNAGAAAGFGSAAAGRSPGRAPPAAGVAPPAAACNWRSASTLR